MSERQMTGAIVLLLGAAALHISTGVAWTLSRLSYTRRVDGVDFITVVAILLFLLFLVGIVLCYFGVSNLVEGSV
ncbi:MAG TPA: hypothetical protein VH591_13620 [Ktedonobacterales bacterium]|jgi:hypothetical protein